MIGVHFENRSTKRRIHAVLQSAQTQSMFSTEIDSFGRISIPVGLRDLMNIKVGDEMLWVRKDTGFWLEKIDQENS